MAKPLAPDELWEVVEPLLPRRPPSPLGGRPRRPDRSVLQGIVLVPRTGVPWECLPMEMRCGSGMTVIVHAPGMAGRAKWASRGWRIRRHLWHVVVAAAGYAGTSRRLALSCAGN